MSPRPAPHQRRLALATGGLTAAFYLLPWLRWQGQQAVLVDLEQRRLRLWALQFDAGDLGTLACAAIAALCLLAVATTLWGRRWCALACPQTLLGRLFARIESATSRQGSARWPALALRHGVWIALSAWTGLTFVGYFSPIATLVQAIPTLGWTRAETLWALFYGAATWGNVVFLREQVCTYLCPYGRLQPLLQDPRTRRFRYDPRRGEPRGPRERLDSVLSRPRGLLNATTAADYALRASYPALAGVMPRFAPEHLGDCVDCAACVQACPRQLDIRSGFTAGCIDCGACADACDAAMAAHGYPNGLIGSRAEPAATAAARPKLWIGAAALAASLAATVLLALH